MVDINKIIDAAADMFPFPVVAKKLLAAIEKDASIKHITEIVSLDPSITAKIIAVANSPFYAAIREITDIVQATARIGFETVRQIAITNSLGKLFSKTDLSGRLLWEHSVAVSLFNKYLAQKSDKIDSESTAGTIGLLHDFGKMVLKKAVPEDYNIIFERFYNGNEDMKSIELDILGISHDYVAGKLAEVWNLGDTTAYALSHHHGPFDKDRELNYYALMTSVADAIANTEGIGRREPIKIEIESSEPFRLLEITVEDTEYAREKGLKEFSDTLNLL